MMVVMMMMMTVVMMMITVVMMMITVVMVVMMMVMVTMSPKSARHKPLHGEALNPRSPTPLSP